MSNLTIALILIAPIVAFAVAIPVAKQTMKKTGSARTAYIRHILSLVLVLGIFSCGTLIAHAAGTTTAAASDVVTAAQANSAGLKAIAGGIAFCGGAIGAGAALSGILPAALGSVSEDRSTMGLAFLFIALGEAIVVYGIAFMFIIKA